jgi:hypothetical protein
MAKKQFLLVSTGLLCTFALLSGCSKSETPEKSPQTAPAKDTTVRQLTEVKVPKNVQGKWKSVKLSILDKETNKEGIVEIEIGKAVKVNGTNLSIKVENFLPHFIMNGTTLTSSSNSPQNPAVQVTITEKDREIFKGWLFTLYPNTHASQHPRYGFSLIDFTPV